jgi:hypothetical protein
VLAVIGDQRQPRPASRHGRRGTASGAGQGAALGRADSGRRRAGAGVAPELTPGMPGIGHIESYLRPACSASPRAVFARKVVGYDGPGHDRAALARQLPDTAV